MVIAYLKEMKPDNWEEWWHIYSDTTGGIVESPKFNANILKKAKKMFTKQKKSYLWLTLSPDKFLRNLDNNEHNLNALNTWCKNWFKYFLGYGEYKWVIENGSEGNHLHVHALLEMKNSHRHAEKLKKSWAKHFPNNQLLTSVDATTKAYKEGKKKGEYCYANFKEDSVDEDGVFILHDKLTYLENEKKGCHENLSDTGFRGSRGFLSDIINENL